MSHIPVPSAGRLGKIQYDPNQKQYCVCKNDRRPGFESHVDVVLPFHGLARCHSYSFSHMQQCFISILNRFSLSPTAVNHISSFVNIFSSLGDAVSRQFLVSAQESFNMAAFAYRVFLYPEYHDYALQQLNALLSCLNSVTGNLRYPASAQYGNSWNRSVQECYDMERWFYVQGGYVHYDETGPIFDTDIRQYLNNRPTLRPLPLPEDGFCIHGQQDRRLLRALLEFNNAVGAPTCAPLQFPSAYDHHAPFLFSSSNTFPLPTVCYECDCVIQFPMTQPDPANPHAKRWVWQVLDCDRSEGG